MKSVKAILAVIVAIAIIVIVGAWVIAIKHSDKIKTPTPANTTSSKQSSSQSTSNSSSATTNPSNANTVSIIGFAFVQANITVKKGTMVTWTNNDTTAHTVTETDSQDGPNSQDLNQGQTYSFTYNTAGTFKYHCSIHSSMTGSVTVTE